MSSSARFYLLGTPTLYWQDEVLEIRSKKSAALLYYLAFCAQAVSRSELAELFWGAGRFQNVRQVLFELRRLPGADSWLDDGDPVGLSATCDAATFVRACQQKDYETALALYQAPLLCGLETRDMPAFEDWLLVERARLHAMYVECLSAQSAIFEHAGKTAEALALLEKIVADDPLYEDAHRRIMAIEWRRGRPDAALAQYEMCRRHLARELGLEPVASTRDLFEAVRTGASPAARSTLGDVATTFIGRAQELAELEACLSEHRLVTLLAQGGMGKTRLAQAFLQSEFAASRPSFFVSLATLRDAKFIPAAIANSLNITFEGPRDPLVQLQQALEHRDILLVLDNLEQIEGAADLIELLLSSTAATLLVTSRRALGLSGEKRFYLRGLDLPESEHDPHGASSGAVRLFVQTAHAMDQRFRVSGGNRALVFRICRLLQGVPLGLELAAGWLRFYSCEELAESLSRDILQLENPGLVLSERHTSLRYVLERSWDYLSETERGTLAQLSVFFGGFGRRAAESVTGTDGGTLQSLSEQSFLYLDAQGRYVRHPLVHAFSQEKLAALGSPHAVRERHAQYFVTLLEAQKVHIIGEQPGAPLARIERDFENIRRAFLFAVRAGWDSLLPGAAEALSLYADMRARFHDALELFGDALSELGEGANRSETRALLLRSKGTHLYRLNRYREALTLADDALSGLAEDSASRAALLRLKASCYYGLADYHESKALFGVTQALARDGEPEQLSRDLRALGNLDVCLGNYEAAETYYREATALDERLGYLIGQAINLNNLAELLIIRGRLGEAEAMIEQSYSYAEGVDAHLIPYLNLNRAELALRRGELGRAERYARLCQNEAAGYAQLTLQSRAACLLARIAFRRKDIESALRHVKDAVSLATETGERGSLLHALCVRGEILLASEPGRARAYLSAVHAHVASEYSDKKRAGRLLFSLDPAPSLENVTLEDLIEDSL